ncbi:uncharacterized protein LOC34619735 [Cyclospora cayetanensis]|uniref:Uncharacterized protein LOC34619735 n=1 Tax=Cyclospora cayetanensis TaxID=88456 RepID=A0A6P6S4W0_9EIME|nr:uncharacterized protein LOC34619735 [Cyclospora cayetanensis]
MNESNSPCPLRPHEVHGAERGGAGVSETAALLAAHSSTTVEAASLRRIGDFLRLVEHLQQQQQQHRHERSGTVVLSVGGAVDDASGQGSSNALRQQAHQQQQLLPALRALLCDLKGICDSAQAPSSTASSSLTISGAKSSSSSTGNSSSSSSSSKCKSDDDAAVAAGAALRPAVRSVVEGMLGATEPMGFPDHKSLLRSLLAIEGVSSETERLRETLSAARSRRTYVETCISPLPPSLSPEGVSSPIYPAEGGAAAEAASEGAPSTLRLLRQEAEAAVQEALATPRLLSMEGGTLRAAQAVRLCGQGTAACSPRFIPKYRGDIRCRTPFGAAAAAAATTAAAAAAAATAAGATVPSSPQYQAWLEGAYIPEFDETDEYTEDTDVGYTALELTQNEFLVAFCGSLMEEATGGPSGMHPLVTMGVEPAVDVRAARLEMAAAAAARAARISLACAKKGAPAAGAEAAEARRARGTAAPRRRRLAAVSPKDACLGNGRQPSAVPAAARHSRVVSSEDELADCGMQEQVVSASDAANLLEQQQRQQQQLQLQQQLAYIAARTWEEAYCEGDRRRFRRLQQARAAAALSLAAYPPSPDPDYPRRCRFHGRSQESGASPADLTTPLDDSAVYDCFNLKVVFKRNTTGCDAHRELVLPSGALLGGRYRIQHEVGAAAFSRCLQGIDVCTGERVCLKVMKNEKEYLDQSLDEVAVLRLLRENGDPDAFRFLRLLDCLYFRGHVVLVTELLDEDLYTFSTALKRHREPSFWTLGRIQVAIRDVLLALKFIHALQIIHGDLKPENILACFTKPLAEFQRHRQEQDRLALRQQAEQCSSSHRVSDNGDASKKLDGSAVGPAAGFDPQALDLFRVKVIDFGNCCFTSDELVVYTQSRCYRAPEVLLELPYCQKIDIWSLGCIVYELWTGDMLLGCHSVPSLLAKMVGIVGPIPNYMARNSPLKHQLIDVEGYLYQFRDSIAETQEQQQHQHAIGFHEPSVNMALRSSEDTLFNVLQDYMKQRQRPAKLPDSRGRSTSSSASASANRIIRFFIPKRTNLRQRLRCNDSVFVDFIAKMLQIDPCQRWSAEQLLAHPFLQPGRYIDGIKGPSDTR